MAIAVHHGGPADGRRVRGAEQTPVRYWAPAEARAERGWVALCRYVFVPPRDGAVCRYDYTGIHQVQGPVPGGAGQPDWST